MHRAVDGVLLMLQQFPTRGIQLVPVSVERDVAAGHHQTAFAVPRRVVHERRSGQCAEAHRIHSGTASRSRGGLKDLTATSLPRDVFCGTGPQIIGQVKLVAGLSPAFGWIQRLEITYFSEHVDIHLQLREVRYGGSTAAGSEGQLARFVIQLRAEAVSRVAHGKSPPALCGYGGRI